MSKSEEQINELLEVIYRRYDSETIEANKKLPKPCYGNSTGYYCNYVCSKREGCFPITMQKWGTCECKFKPSCHIGRQLIQSRRTKNNPNHICDFKKYFDENTYPPITVPDGIIEMEPIID